MAYDISRINELRRIDTLYRVFQPLMRGLAWFNRRLFWESLPGIQREIQAAGLPRFWLPEEYLARLELLALFCGPFYLYMFAAMFGSAGVALAIVAVPLMAFLLPAAWRPRPGNDCKPSNAACPFCWTCSRC